MLYHKYGSTNIKVSAIGFGGMRFDYDRSLEENASLVKAAYDAGINYFDTAPNYGYGKSEEIFGLAVKEMMKSKDRKPFYISTKSMKHDPKNIRKDLETSLERMNLDYIDFYHLWCVRTFDDYQNRKKKGALEEFRKLKEQGLIKHICISTHVTGPEIETILEDFPFEGALMGYSIMNFPYREKGLQAAEKLNRAALVMNPLGGGIIPENPNLFEFVKTNPGESVVQAAIRFLLNDPRITLALVGFTTEQHLAEALSAVHNYKPIPLQKIRHIKNSLHTAFDQLCTACRYCDKCPRNIPVPKLMDTYNQLVLTGSVAKAVQRLKGHWGIDPEENFLLRCTDCGLCEDACTQHLPIRKRMKTLHYEIKKYLEQKTSRK